MEQDHLRGGEWYLVHNVVFDLELVELLQDRCYRIDNSGSDNSVGSRVLKQLQLEDGLPR